MTPRDRYEPAQRWADEHDDDFQQIDLDPPFIRDQRRRVPPISDREVMRVAHWSAPLTSRR